MSIKKNEEWMMFKPAYDIELPSGGIRHFQAIYISNQGNILGRKLSKDGSGYMQFRYHGNVYRLHTELMKLFEPDHEPEKCCVDHINRDRTDNRLENLHWVTAKENARNRSNSYKVQCLETLEMFNSCWEAADKYNIRPGAISNAINPNNDHKTAAGYHWIKYIEPDGE